MAQVVGRNQPGRQGWHPSYCTRDCNNSCLTITGVPGTCLFSMGGVYLRTCSGWPFCNRTLPPDKTLIDWARDGFDILQRLLGFLSPNFQSTVHRFEAAIRRLAEAISATKRRVNRLENVCHNAARFSGNNTSNFLSLHLLNLCHLP